MDYPYKSPPFIQMHKLVRLSLLMTKVILKFYLVKIQEGSNFIEILQNKNNSYHNAYLESLDCIIKEQPETRFLLVA